MTNTVKTIVCLANSRKLSGRCIAGRELLDNDQPGGWVRPVSARDNEEVSEYERQYEDGNDPKLLDVIRVPLLSHQPSNYQSENWLLDPSLYWEKGGKFAIGKLCELVDPASDLWTVGSSTQNGLNDRIREADATKLADSLRLIELSKLGISVYAPGMQYGNSKRRVQAHLEYNGKDYKLWVTDPIYERKYLGKNNGSYSIGPCYVTVSLGEPYNGYCYSFVAAIIEKP